MSNYLKTKNNLTERSITGIILAIIILGTVSWNLFGFIFLVLIIDLLSLLEFYRLFYSTDLLPRKVAGIILSVSMLIACTLYVAGIISWKILFVAIPIAFGIFVMELFHLSEKPFYNLAFTFLGVICITIPLCFFITLAFFPYPPGTYNLQLVLGYFFILWASDTGAYFIGKNFGIHHLFKRISPKKTWEGSAGGAASAILVSYLLSYFFTFFPVIDWVFIAVIIIVTGTCGDLVKSMMKRSLNLKDSGTILPGHGGMLDRFDSLLGSAPFVCCYLILFHHG
ncbi:phosphatidate cytidylyltransferase [Flavihumibacter profundi]|uniref:phosphatidate cytidylyltransferase n=1 Tax=Flavihumibacter profundi TaxID=2716883 RepID=UPI001CC7BFF2|nr:phosphatidate cytidylyltransferase [Flavihumibacter profundi]MBZ5856331.1 phosphatidate cytidylyltransferase [Flavihumibacter profundi]